MPDETELYGLSAFGNVKSLCSQQYSNTQIKKNLQTKFLSSSEVYMTIIVCHCKSYEAAYKCMYLMYAVYEDSWYLWLHFSHKI